VVYIGSASKILAPGLRLGWVVAPEDMRSSLERHKALSDAGSPIVEQLIRPTGLVDPEVIVRAADELLDLSQPVGLFFMGVLGHIEDYDEARGIVGHLLGALPSGSYLAIYDGIHDPAAAAAAKDYGDTGAVPYVLRSPEELAGFFEGLELVEPGVVSVTRWRPEDPTAAALPDRAGVARKP
jgi:hypothetical protein